MNDVSITVRQLGDRSMTDRAMIKHSILPNSITLLRVLLAAPFVWIVYRGIHSGYFLALVVFLVAVSTDFARWIHSTKIEMRDRLRKQIRCLGGSHIGHNLNNDACIGGRIKLQTGVSGYLPRSRRRNFELPG